MYADRLAGVLGAGAGEPLVGRAGVAAVPAAAAGGYDRYAEFLGCQARRRGRLGREGCARRKTGRYGEIRG